MNVISKTAYFGKDLEDMAFAENYHRWVIERFKPYLGDATAEIGAGTGNFTSFLVNAKIKCIFAFEPSDNIYPLLKNKFQEKKEVVTINAFLREKYQEFLEFFDSVLYINVLEHIESDQEELRFAYETIKKNGFILIFAPALPWLYSTFDKKIGHFRRYSQKRLVEIVKKSGFLIEDIRYFDIVGAILWYIVFVLFNKTTTKNNVYLYDKFIVPSMRFFENIIKPPIGKNLLLVGKKI